MGCIVLWGPHISRSHLMTIQAHSGPHKGPGREPRLPCPAFLPLLASALLSTPTSHAGLATAADTGAQHAAEGRKEREKGWKEEKNSFGKKHAHMQLAEHCDLDYFWNLMFLMFKGRK